MKERKNAPHETPYEEYVLCSQMHRKLSKSKKQKQKTM